LTTLLSQQRTDGRRPLTSSLSSLPFTQPIPLHTCKEHFSYRNL